MLNGVIKELQFTYSSKKGGETVQEEEKTNIYCFDLLNH